MCPNNEEEATDDQYTKKEMTRTLVIRGKVMVEKIVIETKSGKKIKHVYMNGKLGRFVN